VTTYHIEPFRREHLAEMRRDGHDWLALLSSLHNYERNPGFSGFADGRLVGAAGVVFCNPGVADAWAMVTPLVHQHRVFFHRTVKRLMSHVMKMNQLHRIQATVFADDNSLCRCKWIEALEFKYEGRLRKYTRDGRDALVYAYVP
jgi:hypothetical protein